MTNHSPFVLIVLDGWGHREDPEGNAIHLARTAVWDELWDKRPHTLISGSGMDVGLPAGQMGNSEVGHMNLGAGRVVDQDFTRISKAVQVGSFFDNATLKQAITGAASKDRTVHIFGLLSPGGVHSHEEHLKAAVTMAFQNGAPRVYVHAFLDGRDVPPRSAMPSLTAMQQHIQSHGEGGIVSVVGRYYAMDRDKRWDRTALAYDLVTRGHAEFEADTPEEALEAAYERGEDDEFVKPTAVRLAGERVTMADGDAVIYMNFRADRARQLTRAFVNDDFSDFERPVRPELSAFVMLTQYAADIHTACAYEPDSLTNGLGEYIAGLDKRQLRLAETEKYAHVTFFFSGGREEPFEGEKRLLIPSPRVATYDLQPEMSAMEVTDELVKAIESKDYELIVCNYANGDMVGHTGKMDAALKAVECIDECLGRIVKALETTGGQCLITADHGNVEQMNDEQTGQPHTAHTSELVPLVYIGPKDIALDSEGGTLSDVAPTILTLMELPIPDEMTGRSLVIAPKA
ncbi:MAG: 2,3-bisphosphoglycerate-independent phosphoglycerate mutase, partial [Pseudomonadales bacterium]|nr:2,3-bisphosphoglycerate-independent phosphoglycerate mutase [Pseudomonadales bacterium]